MHRRLDVLKARRIATTRAIAKSLGAAQKTRSTSKSKASEADATVDQIPLQTAPSIHLARDKEAKKKKKVRRVGALRTTGHQSVTDNVHEIGIEKKRLLVFFSPEKDAMVMQGACSVRCLRGLVEIFGAVLRGPELFEASSAQSASSATAGGSLEPAEQRMLPPHDPSSSPAASDGPYLFLTGTHTGAAVLRAHPPSSHRFVRLQSSGTRSRAPAAALEELSDPLTEDESTAIASLLASGPPHFAAVLLSTLPDSYRIPSTLQSLLSSDTFTSGGAKPTPLSSLFTHGSFPRAVDEQQEKRLLWHAPFEWVSLGDELRALQTTASPASAPLVVLVTGEQSAGKSGLCVHLCNALATAHHGRVLLLDCDPGQPLLQPPGGVALHLLTRPLLAPSSPVCPLRSPLLAHFLGDLTPKSNTKEYLAAIESLVRWYHTLAALTCNSYGSEMPPPPLIVNMPGWVKGEGYNLLLDTLRTVSPTHLVELRKQARALRPLVRLHHLRALEPAPSQVIRMAAVQAASTKISLHSGTIREMQFTAYFDGGTGLPLSRLVPYAVPFSRIRLHLPPEVAPSEILNALNGSLVALCCDPEAKYQPAEGTQQGSGLQVVTRRAPSTSPLFWKALGLVSSVSVTDKLLYIHTPLSERDTVQLTDLVLSPHMHPPLSLFAAPSVSEGPYITASFLPARLAPGFVSSTHVKRKRHQKEATDGQSHGEDVVE